jgi:predicted ATPase
MITAISINNFKSIRNASIKMPQFSAIVGNNAAGKTNLLKAIGLFKSLVSGNSVEAAQDKIGSPSELFNHNESSRELMINMELSLNDDIYLFEVLISLNAETSNFLIAEEKLQRKIKTNHNSDEFEIIYQRDQKNLKNNEGKTIPLNVEAGKLAIAIYKEDKALPVRKFFTNLIICDFENTNLRESINVTEGSLSALLVRLRHKHPDAYHQFQQIVAKMMPSFSSIVEIDIAGSLTPPEGEKYYYVVLEEKNLKGILSMQSISSGDLRTLFIMATAISMRSGSTLIIEEIENAMHPYRVKDIVERLEVIALKNGIQILFTTHSPIVINSLAPKKVIFTSKNASKGTTFIVLNESKHLVRVSNFLESGGDLTEYLESLVS